MAITPSTLWVFYKAFRTRMRLRANITAWGVAVLAAPSGEPVPAESIQLFGTSLNQQWGLLGNRRREEQYTVRGGIFVKRRGAGEDIADVVRDRVGELLAEVEDELRTTPNVGIASPRVIAEFSASGSEIDQGAEDDGRWCAIDFSIAVKASLTST